MAWLNIAYRGHPRSQWLRDHISHLPKLIFPTKMHDFIRYSNQSNMMFLAKFHTKYSISSCFKRPPDFL